MATTSYQYTIFDKIKFGFSMLFRCFNCFHNIYEKFQFMAFAQQSCPNTIPFLYCPYCKNKVYTLEEEPGGYSFMISSDQSTLYTFTILLEGSNGTDYTIIWGDNKLSKGTFDGTIQNFTHDYSTEDIYHIKIFLQDFNLFYIRISEQNLDGSIPTFKDFSNIYEIFIRNTSTSSVFPEIDGLQSLLSVRFVNIVLTNNFPLLNNVPLLEKIVCRTNNLSGIFPSLNNITSLGFINVQDNNFTGSLPSFDLCTDLYYFNFDNNNFSGSIPDLSTNILLEKINIDNNSISGIIPSLSTLTVLNRLSIFGNNLSGYTASILALTLVDTTLNNNLLTQTAVDQILSDFNDNLASRPGSGILNLGGTGNATPSATGLIHKANIIAHGWTVTTN